MRGRPSARTGRERATGRRLVEAPAGTRWEAAHPGSAAALSEFEPGQLSGGGALPEREHSQEHGGVDTESREDNRVDGDSEHYAPVVAERGLST
jgi:hypothetical protein